MRFCPAMLKTFSEAGLRGPGPAGFSHFGQDHLLWLAGLGAASFLLFFLQGKASPGRRQRIRKGLGLFFILLHLLTQGTLLLRGVYGLYDLPLHLCALTVYLILLHTFLGKRPELYAAMGEILFFPCLPGLVSALIFPGWNEFPAFSFYSCSSFLSHGAMALYILLCLMDGSIRPSARRSWIPVLFLGAYTGLVLPFDLAFGPNFGFLKEPVPGTPLQLIADYLGRGEGYRAGFALLVLVLEVLSYSFLRAFKRQKKAIHEAESKTETRGRR